MRVILSLCLACACAHAATWYVSPTGNDAAPGSSAQPFRTVQRGLDALAAGDVLEVRAGTYSGYFRLETTGTANAWITVRAAAGAAVILDGQGADDSVVLTLAGGVSYARVEGLVIRNARGYGLLLAGNNTNIELRRIEATSNETGLRVTDPGIPGGTVDRLLVEECRLHHNSLLGFDLAPGPGTNVTIRATVSEDNGAGTNDTAADGFAFESGSDILIEDCRAERNAGDGIDTKADRVTIRRCHSIGNAREGIKPWGTDSRIENCLVTDNGFTGIVGIEGGSYTMINNTVAFNAVQSGNYGMYIAYDGPQETPVTLRNNVFAFNGSAVFFGTGVRLTESNNVFFSTPDIEIEFAGRGNFTRQEIQDGTWAASTGGGAGTRSVDPGFIDGAGRNLRLTAGSPCVNAGSATGAPTDDLLRERRPNGGAVDMGCYERRVRPEGEAFGGMGTGGGGYVEVWSGGPTFAHLAWARSPLSAYNAAIGEARPACADVDGDGREELIVGLAPNPGDGGWVAVLEDGVGGYAFLRWLRVPWLAFRQAGGSTWVAGGDLDGDGRGEIVVGLGGTTVAAGYGLVFDDGAAGYAARRWFRLPWSAYDAAVGEIRVACGDVDGDGRAEVVVGTARYPSAGGWMCVFDDLAKGLAVRRWARVPDSAYDAANGEVRPACGDLDGDGRAEVVAGLGAGGAGWVHRFEDLVGGLAWRGRTQMQWSAYTSTGAGVRPACGDLDGDGIADLLLGTDSYPSSGGRLEVLRGRSLSHIAWLTVRWAVYNSANGSTWPAIGRTR